MQATAASQSFHPNGPEKAGRPELSGLAGQLAELASTDPVAAEFARFVQFRSDLLKPHEIDAVRTIRTVVASLPREHAAAAAPSLAHSLEGDGCWSTLARCGFRAQWKGQAVVAHVARDPVPASALDKFAVNLRGRFARTHPDLASPAVLSQFKEWIRLSEPLDRERSYLQALATMRNPTGATYPELIPEICTDRALCWKWVEGESLSAQLARRDKRAASLLAEAVLEQICVLALVDTALDLEHAVVVDGHLAFRGPLRFSAIPAPRVRAALRYVSAVLSGNSAVSARALLKLAWGPDALTLESRLLDELSHLTPELKGNRRFPASATVFEGNWRALQRVNGGVPLYLDGMHRNLALVGYLNAETAPNEDLIADGQWPVVGRLLRIRVGGLFDRETATEWIAGGGLLLFESMRQASRLADEFRENELSIGVDSDAAQGSGNGDANRSVQTWIMVAFCFTVFVVSLRWAAILPAPYATVCGLGAVLGAVGLFWSVSRSG